MTTQPLSPFASVPNAVAVESLPDIMDLRLAIVGQPGVGKSWLAATAPPPVLHYDFDNRAASLRQMVHERGLKDIKVVTYVDNQDTPTTMTNLENDLVMLKSAKAARNPVPRSYILDSATYLRKSMEYTALKQDSQMGTKIKITATRSIRAASAMTSANWIRGYFEYLINEFATLGHVIVVFHEKDEIDKDKTKKEDVAYTGKLCVEPQYLNLILSIFNERWRVSRDYQMKYQVSCKNDRIFDAVTSLNIDDVEEPDIMKILKKHQDRIGAKK
jgi:hypothetical protein